MRRHPRDLFLFDLFLRNRWIMQKAKLVVVARMETNQTLHVRFGELKAIAHGPENNFGSLVQAPIELCHEPSVSWQSIFWQPYICLRRILLAANVVAFLLMLSFGPGAILGSALTFSSRPDGVTESESASACDLPPSCCLRFAWTFSRPG